MSVEGWIVKARLATCLKCRHRAECEKTAGRIASLTAEVTTCPMGWHPSRDEAVAARAWPETAPKVSGCCDRIG